MYDVVVIGAGPAGISASIQLKRSGIEPLLLEKDKAGGLLLNANLVENYPGFPDGVSGKKLAEIFLKHLKNAGVLLRKRIVKKMFRENNIFHIVTDKDKFLARCVILATGTLPKKLGISGESPLAGKRLFYEIKNLSTNTGRFTVVGSGDITFDYALNLSKTAEEIGIIIRGKKAKCIPVLVGEAKKRGNIEIHYRAIPVSVKEKEGNVVLKCSVDAEYEDFVSDYVLVATGRTPNTGMLSDELKKHVVPALFFAGDVKNGDFRQTGISVGDGLLSGMKVVKFLREKT